MGAFASVPECQTHYNIKPNCDVTGVVVIHPDGSNSTDAPYTKLGEYTPGNVPGDPDIAGVGILGVFVGVTSFAVLISIIDIFWQLHKTFREWKAGKPRREKITRARRVSYSDILETLVLACSDQQVFIGAAYALTLRYWRGCTVSAYHYNIIANMLLLTCATHLMSVTIVRNYWKYPWLAILRILSISGLFITTGILFTNQNARKDYRFPTGIPPANETNSLLFLPAACFQTEQSAVPDTFKQTTATGAAFFDVIGNSTPDNKIQGFNLYILTLLFYGAALLAEGVRFVRRGKSRVGWRGDAGKWFGKCFKEDSFPRKFVQSVFLLYLFLGTTLGSAVTVISAKYIFDLRRWVDRSGWLKSPNPENDATSFGQLVPIFSGALIVFSFFQIFSEKLTKHANRKHAGEEVPPQQGTIHFLDPSNYDITSPPLGLGKTDTGYFGAAGMFAADSRPPRVDLEHQSSWESTISLPAVSTPSPPKPGCSAAKYTPIVTNQPNSPATPPAPKLPSTFSATSPRPEILNVSPIPLATVSLPSLPSKPLHARSSSARDVSSPGECRPLMGTPTSSQHDTRPMSTSRSSTQLFRHD